MDEADKLCDRIAIVDHGELKALDSPLKLKASIPGKNVLEVELLGGAAGLGRHVCSGCRTSRRSRATDNIFRLALPERTGDDAGADGAGGAVGVAVHVAVGAEHDTGRRLRALHGSALRDALQEANPSEDAFALRA